MDDTQTTLEELLQACGQAERCFRTGADHAQAEDVRALLRRRAEECMAAVAEFEAHARRLGIAPSPAAGQAAAAHAGASVVRATLASHGDQALLEACERSEDALLECYVDAMARPLLEPALKEAVSSQRLETRRQHELLRAMRDRLRGLA